ncbi:MAG TPA: aldo/keto reductase [Trebonia sp.]
MADGDLLSYLRAEPQLTMVAYSSLMRGGYVRLDKLEAVEFAEYDHPGTPARLAALRKVAKDAGATVNQVVLAWLIGGGIPITPVVGASSVTQLDESLAAVDLELTTVSLSQRPEGKGPGSRRTGSRGHGQGWSVEHHGAAPGAPCPVPH